MPTRAQAARCETVARMAPPVLRGHTIGYGSFRSADGRAIAHRLLPISLAALVVDLASAKAVVTGPRASSGTDGETTWGCGVSIGLTPAGVAALLGVPMRELTARSLLLEDLVGRRAAAELPERLAEAPDWPARFRLLDTLLTHRLGRHAPARDPHAPTGEPHAPAGVPRGREGELVMVAWGYLQRGGGRLRVGDLAARLGVGRRGLEREFRAAFGLSPGVVGRIARFQRALALVQRGLGFAEVAAVGGYADQAHFTREMRAMAGITPGELRAIVQDPGTTGA
ncbi:hypothetical protein GCM10010172_45020 [Paractinoplanes ferrugineus]|uniref:HTH araC/xylS-type domain-containing protein n=1 Tax=Paractinoplanes ferrugineus TaxID=113564 RepID=A0A919IZN6_9ACTN|nr:helix-turn-helix domain-containing protein [Actinoplanes ferrugineus]GIE11183.1 hypothetical protein Afe05nite_30230 [Actinoplanes ferrugineus]